MEPEGSAGPRYFHGPAKEGAEWTAILPPVEKRKYVPSSARAIEGSWVLVQVPEHGRGSGKPAASADRRRRGIEMIESMMTSTFLTSNFEKRTSGSNVLENSEERSY